MAYRIIDLDGDLFFRVKADDRCVQHHLYAVFLRFGQELLTDLEPPDLCPVFL